MTIREALKRARGLLHAAGSDEAEIEAEVLLRHILDVDRGRLFQSLDLAIDGEALAAYEQVLARRSAGEPTAYITGKREFAGREFKVTPAVLIPRPETELLVDIAAGTAREAAFSPRLVDVGTGSGAIAVSLARVLPGAEIYATDISPEAIAVARENAGVHGVGRRVSMRRGDMLEPIDTRVHVIVANLPYVSEDDWARLPREIRDHEPRLALASGRDGLDAIERLINQAPAYLLPGGSLVLEFGFGQEAAVDALARRRFPAAAINCLPDFADIPRVLTVGPV